MKTALTLLIFLTVFSINIFAQESPHTVLERHSGNVYSVAFSPDGQTLLSRSRNRSWDPFTYYLWNVDTGEQKLSFTNSIAVFSPDGQMLASSSSDNIRLWDVDTGTLKYTLPTNNVRNVVFSPDGHTLASSSDENTIYLWVVETGTLKHTLIEHTDRVWNVEFSPNGQTIASSSDKTIRLWNVETGMLKHTLPINNVWIVKFSPDGQILVSAGSDENTIHLWDVETGTLKHTLTEHTDRVWRAVFSPDGQMLASSSSDKTIRLWDVETGTLKHTLPTNNVWIVEFSPDGQTLLNMGANNTVRLWDVDTGALNATLIGHRGSVNSVIFSPDGQTLASGSNDNTVRLWDVDTGALNATLIGPRGGVNSVIFSPDGQTLASGSNDNTVRLWKIIDTRIGITVLPVNAPAIGDQLTLKVDITKGENVTGFQAKVGFDATALRYVNSYNGDYLPNDSFFVDPVIEGNKVILGATSLADSSSGNGTLATLTFEFIAIKESTVTLPEAAIVDSKGERLPFFFKDISHIVGVPRLREDVNLDGVVDVLDLTFVAASFGKKADRNPELPDIPEDVNNDGVIDIVDLVLVAGALGNKATAPSAYPQVLATFTAADVQKWLTQAQQLNLTDATSQRGIHFLEQLLAALTPKKTSLLPNYPNPFNPETWIPYQLAESADVTVTIYAVDGKVVRRLALGHKSVGIYQGKSRAAHWNGKNALGEPVASGVYFYTLKAEDFTATRKMLIRK
ncbi:T9SS type A sorting domain-containing protein [Candidatus Poribacteria bacterium]|nr:T9SS type A sorting domain-containing protein [Candidatus Poribacteria bacterium]